MLRQIFGQAKKHPSLIPLFIFIGAGGTGAALYVLRLALFNPDVSWDRKNNPEPWNKLGPNDQYKRILMLTHGSKKKQIRHKPASFEKIGKDIMTFPRCMSIGV
ncbi:cytochrome c oxidase subunit NDUFA4 isoform X1 [Panthera onca]